jgi:hypothetical protein
VQQAAAALPTQREEGPWPLALARPSKASTAAPQPPHLGHQLGQVLHGGQLPGQQLLQLLLQLRGGLRGPAAAQALIGRQQLHRGGQERVAAWGKVQQGQEQV